MPKRRKGKRLSKARNPRRRGALHRELGISRDQKIGRPTLTKVKNTPIGGRVRGHAVTRKIKQQAVWALNINRGK